MKKLNEIPTSELAQLLGVQASYASQLKTRRTKPSAKVAQQINEAFDVPLWEIRPDIYPRHLFDCNDPTHQSNAPRPNNEESNNEH